MDCNEKFIVLGLNEIMKTKFSPDKSLKLEILERCPNILEERLGKLELSIQKDIVGGILKSNPSALLNEFWVNYSEEALGKFEGRDKEAFLHRNGGWFVLLNRVRDMQTDGCVDWFKVLSRLSKSSVSAGYMTCGFQLVLNWLIAADKKNLLRLLHKAETKKYPREVKRSLYCNLISFGLLDEKVARRIRSDTSGELSYHVLSHLFQNRDKYSDEKFQDLITQFTDTRHKWVARFISINIPLELAPFLMGLEDRNALSIIENRLNAGG